MENVKGNKMNKTNLSVLINITKYIYEIENSIINLLYILMY